MKAKIFIMTLLVMILSAVQGYAQRENRGNTRSRARVERPQRSTVRPSRTPAPRRSPAITGRSSARPSVSSRSAPSSRFVRNTAPQRETPRRSAVTARRERTGIISRRSGTPQERHGIAPRRPASSSRNPGISSRRPPAPSHAAPRHRPPAPRRGHMPPPPHRPWRPVFGHHHGYLHHHHHCYFNSWYWYTWGGYHNRFICHRLYHNRFFDSLLGYYIWGAINAPTKLEIGNMILTRYNNTLKVQVGNSVSYLDLYRYQTVSYLAGYTSIDVTTGNGSALVRFYDDYGNEATYRL